ncbi:hypothetical protein HYX02_04525 [Candidatus Woesearchaeota archaeon]|nr:hypothetical protein [Candidatus Woesearchaeota archaeon]
MSKNKTALSIALFLVAAALLPIAYAQTLAGGSIFYVLVNALIVGVILFMLQAFLLPQKDPKEQTAVWVAIIVGSLLIAWFYGSQGYIWKVGPLARYLRITFFVNTFLIGVIAYFILGFLDVQSKLKSTQGQGGFALIIFLVAAIWAAWIQGTYGDKFIWEAYQGVVQFLIGPNGILTLRPPHYRLAVLTSSFFLLSYFFNTYLITGTGADKKINYALAAVMAINMASSGISPGVVVQLGEFIFILTLARALEGTAGKGYMQWIIAVLLVGWASAAIFSDTKPEYMGWAGRLIGIPFMTAFGLSGGAKDEAWYLTLIKFPLKAWWLLLLLGLGGFAIARGEKRASRVWHAFKKYGINPFLRGLRKYPMGPIKWLLQKWTAKDLYLTGELPPVFQDIRAELMMLMNYQTRSHTYIGKQTRVVEFLNQAKGIEVHFEQAAKTYDKMRASLDNKYRFGGVDQAAGSYGWSNNRDLIALLFNELKQVLENEGELKKEVVHETASAKYRGPLKEILDNRLDLMQKAYSQFKTNVKRMGLIHRLRSLKIKLLDLLALYGAYKHYYRFANEDALFEKWKWKLENSEVVPTKRDEKWEEEREKVVKPIKDRSFNQIVEKIKNEKRDELYEAIKAEFRTEIEKKVSEYRQKYPKAKPKVEITGEAVKRAVDRLLQAREKGIQEVVERELRKRTSDIRQGKVNADELRYQLYEKYKAEFRTELETKVRKQYEDYKKKVESAEALDEMFIQNAINKTLQSKENQIRTKVEAELKNMEEEINQKALIEFESDDIQKKIIKEVPDKYKLNFVATTNEGKLRHEVDIKGFVLKDMHEIEVDGKGEAEMPLVRRVKIQDIEDFQGDTAESSTFDAIIPKILSEWDFLIQDLRWGNFHPFSRSSIDYTKIINEQKILNFTYVGRTRPSKDQNIGAFDLEALKVSGKWVYWGKRNYWDLMPELKNSYPTLSTVGLSRFITEIVRLRVSNVEIADKYLSYWVWDTGVEDRVFTTLLGKEEK